MRFRLEYRESILSVLCDDGLEGVAYDAMFAARSAIESKIAEDPFFGRMCDASVIAGVGPMAGVAGAVAVSIAERLVQEGSTFAIAENGGDIAFYSKKPRLVGIYAAHPVLRDMAFSISSDRIVGICSSSRVVGPSVSLGNSSISTVFSDDVILADCCATALGNLVKDEGSMEGAVEDIGSRPGVKGCVACCGDRVAMFGDVPEMVPADCVDLCPRDPLT